MSSVATSAGRWRRRLLRILLLLLVGLVVGVGLALFWLRHQGIQWQGPGWQEGALTLERLQWQGGGGCPQLVLSALALQARPWRLRVELAHWLPCPDADAEAVSAPPSWPEWPSLPPLRVDVAQLSTPWLSLEQLWLSHEDGLVKAGLQAQGEAQATLALSRDGHWQVSGQGQLAPWVDGLDGLGFVTGAGRRWQGRLQGRAEGLQWRNGPAPTVLEAAAILDGSQWQLIMDLPEPVQVTSDWQLSLPRPLQMRGSWDGLQGLDGALTLSSGPQRLHWQGHSAADRWQAGNGSLTLEGEWLQGQVAMDWDHGVLRLLPAGLTGPEGMQLTWTDPVSVPLSPSGQVQWPLQGIWQAWRLDLAPLDVQWGATGVRAQGRLALTGGDARLQASGQVAFQATPDHLQLGESSWQARADGAVASLLLPAQTLTWQAPQLQGQWQLRHAAATATGTLRAGWDSRGPAGQVTARARVSALTAPLDLSAHSGWRWQDGALWLLEGQVELARSVQGDWLVLPVQAHWNRPLRVTADGLRGDLLLQGQGGVMPRARVPGWQARLHLRDWQGTARLALEDWSLQGTLDWTLDPARGRWFGDMSAQVPLQPALSQSLDLVLQSGQLALDGHFDLGARQRVELDARVSGLALDWGGLSATGVEGQVRARWQDGRLHAFSPVPLTVERLDVGVPVEGLRLGFDTDLSSGALHEVSARVLGGEVRAARLQWPSTALQTVTATGIDLAQLARLQAEPVVALQGRVGGELPLRLGTQGVIIEGGQMRNEGTLGLQLLPSAGLEAMAEANMAVQLALDSLQRLDIHDLRADVDMQEDGWLSARVGIRGINPEQQGAGVVFNYTHQENMRVLLRSLRIADEISAQAMESVPGPSTTRSR